MNFSKYIEIKYNLYTMSGFKGFSLSNITEGVWMIEIFNNTDESHSIAIINTDEFILFDPSIGIFKFPDYMLLEKSIKILFTIYNMKELIAIKMIHK